MLSARALVVRTLNSIVSPPIFTLHPQRSFVHTNKKVHSKGKSPNSRFSSKRPNRAQTENPGLDKSELKLLESRQYDVLSQVLEKKKFIPSNVFKSIVLGLGSDRGIPKPIAASLFKTIVPLAKLTTLEYNIMLGSLQRLHLMDEFWTYYEMMRNNKINPDASTYNTLISAANRANDPEKMKSLFREMLDRRLIPDIITYNTLLNGLSKSNEHREFIEELISTLDSSTQLKKDVVTYNNLLKIYGQDKKMGKIAEILKEMKKNFISHNIFTYNILLNVMSKNGNNEQMLEYFDEMKLKGINPDAVAYTTVITAMANEGNIDMVSKFLEEMKSKGIKQDIVTFNVLMNAYAERGDLLSSMNLYKQLKANNLQPTESTFGALFKAAIKAKDSSQVGKLWEDAKSANLLKNVVLWTEVMRVYTADGDYKKALNTFDLMKRSGIVPDYPAWGVALLSAAESKDPNLVEQYWQQLKTVGFPISAGLYKTKIMASLRTKDINGALNVFHELAELDYLPKLEQIQTFLTTFLEHFRGHIHYEKAVNFERALSKSDDQNLPASMMKSVMTFLKSLEQVRVNVPRNK